MSEYTPYPQAAMSDYKWSHSNCNDCDRRDMSAREARNHYVITGHFVVTQAGATYEGGTEVIPDAMPRTIASTFLVSLNVAREMHDDTSGSTYERDIENTHVTYDTASGMLTIETKEN